MNRGSLAARAVVRTMVRALVLGVLGVLAVSVGEAQQAPASAPLDTVAPIFRRAQRLVNDGNGAEGRRLIDSVLNATEPRSPEEAEALFWRATLAASWDDAQRDYLRIMLEHERSPRAAEAMLRLAQGESARGDRDAALRYLERLAREAPESTLRGEAGLWHGRLLLERGSRTEGCTLMRATRPMLPPGALELENQYDYLLRACPAAESIAPAPAAPTVEPTPTPARIPARAPAGAPAWSVQVAAFGTASEAAALVQKLGPRGYDARVDGTVAPFRVRFGRYRTHAEAAAAAADYKAKERGEAFVVEAPRG